MNPQILKASPRGHPVEPWVLTGPGLGPRGAAVLDPSLISWGTDLWKCHEMWDKSMVKWIIWTCDESEYDEIV